MYRRQFLTTSIATSFLALRQNGSAETPAATPRDYYQVRRYRLQSGPQLKLTESYISDALIPALARRNIGPIGAFRLDIGPETPAFYLLIPGSSLDMIANIDRQLSQDDAFMKIADPFWNAPATAPAFLRLESSLLVAFEGWPHLTPPAATATKGKRIFQLRTYESPSNRDHLRKIEMFNNAEFELFKNAGFHPVFFGDTLIGPQMPNLTYMLSFADMNMLNEQWDVFRNDPSWKKLSTSPRYGYEAIVSNISNLILSPLDASQI
ncbi:MAG: NIPSNAP family protein [Terracidiphilus sp.]|jgi:hypothetical protein